MSTESMMPSSHPILCQPLLLSPLIFPSIRVFSKGSALHIKWPKYWSFSFSIVPSSEYSGLISFRIDWFDLLTNHGPLEKVMATHSRILAWGTPWTVWKGREDRETECDRWVCSFFRVPDPSVHNIVYNVRYIYIVSYSVRLPPTPATQFSLLQNHHMPLRRTDNTY